MNASDTVTIPPQVMSRQVGDELVILDLESGTYYGLDLVGARIWELLETGSTFREVCETLVAEFDASIETIRHDAAKLLDTLCERKLIVVTSGG